MERKLDKYFPEDIVTIIIELIQPPLLQLSKLPKIPLHPHYSHLEKYEYYCFIYKNDTRFTFRVDKNYIETRLLEKLKNMVTMLKNNENITTVLKKNENNLSIGESWNVTPQIYYYPSTKTYIHKTICDLEDYSFGSSYEFTMILSDKQRMNICKVIEEFIIKN